MKAVSDATMNGFSMMDTFDLEWALAIYCNTSTRQFLFEVFRAYGRIENLQNQLDETSVGFAKRGDLIAELNNRVQALERMAEDRLMRVKQLESDVEVAEGTRLNEFNHWDKREQELVERIHQLEAAYDEVDREYKAALEALEFEQGLASELDTTVRELDTMLKRNAVRDGQTIADRDEDIRKLKMQIIELEQRNERLNTIVEAKRGVEQ